MSVGSLFNTSTSALRAAYAQLQTTGHNIANVNTPGYTRQEVILSSANATGTSGGFIGRGVDVTGVQRRYDQFLTAEVVSGTAAVAADKTRAEQIGRLERMLADTDNGIGVAIDDLNQAFADLVNRPFDTTARAVVISRANTLAERFRSVSSGFEQLGETIDARLFQDARSLNGMLSDLSSVNNLIARSQGSGQPPNDLLDQRDQLVEKINGLIKTNAISNPDGTVNLYSASGHALVVGNAVAKFSVAPQSLDPTRMQLVLTTSGTDVPIPGEMLGGGEIAGLLRFRDQDLEAARARLGQLAVAVASAYNDQQALGRTPAGVQGDPLFSIKSPLVTPSIANAGTASLTAAVVDGSKLAASDYRILYNGSDYSVTRVSDGTTTAVSAWPATIDGLAIDLGGGVPSAGDEFLVRGASGFAGSFAVSLSLPSRIATGYAMTPERGASNVGDIAARTFAVNANDANLVAPVTITFDGAGTFSVSGTGTGNPTGIAYVAGMSVAYNGWEMTLSGTPEAGDTITVTPTLNPATDNRNARAMLGLADKGMVEGRRFTDAFAELLADVGVRSQSVNASVALSERVLLDAQAARGAESGVNLDEEAARLMQYQQAYQAAAKLLATAQAVFEEILRTGR